jgi:hypothetical protein
MNIHTRLKAIGNLLLGKDELALKSVYESFATNNYRGDDGSGFFFFGPDGAEYKFKFAGRNSSLTAYRLCSPLNAIINKKAQAYINGKTWVLNSRGKEATSDEAKKLRKLLKQPNPLQSGKQFEAQGYIYQQLFGFNVILALKPVGFRDNIDASTLWNIPPFMIDIEETEKLFYQSDTKGIIKRIILNYKGRRTEIPVEEVFIMKDIVPSFESLVIPESRVCSLEMPINNIIGAYESRNVLINYRGALGILTADKDSMGTIPLNTTDKEELQRDFRRYGLSNKQWQVIITSAALKCQNMGYATKDLMLFEEIEDDIMRICDEYNFPYQLMASAKGSTFANMKEGKQLLYQDAIIPEAESICEQWNQFFDLERFNLTLSKDFSHIPALQADKQHEATARKTLNEAKKIEWDNNLITLNQWLVALGEDTIGPDGDVRAWEIKNLNAPLVTIIGLEGVQSIMTVLSNGSLAEEAKKNVLQILFGVTPADAARMVIKPEPDPALLPINTSSNNQNPTNEPSQENDPVDPESAE